MTFNNEMELLCLPAAHVKSFVHLEKAATKCLQISATMKAQPASAYKGKRPNAYKVEQHVPTLFGLKFTTKINS